MFFGLPIYTDSSLKKSFRGFTLIELMIAISVIAIISTIGLSVYSNGQRLARDSRRKADLLDIKNGLSLYAQDFKHYPCTTGWQFTPTTTTSSFWISNVFTGTTGCGSATDTRAFNTSHIGSLPADPMRNGGVPYNDDSFGYGYWASVTTAASCPPVRPGYGNTFLLVAQLENDSDPDRIANSNFSWCGANLFTGTSGGTIPSGTSFVLAAD